jgi:chemotaxis protein histidine kinase CheA
MKIYIDTNTFSASPGIYADAEKTKPLPRIVPAVELERGGLEVAFLGENIPAPTDALAIAASIEGTRTQVIAEYGVPVEDAPHATWLFQCALNSEELVKAVEARGSTHLRVGIIATAGEQKRTEWQFLAAVFSTASGEIDGKQVQSAKDWSDAAMRFARDAEDSAKFADEKAQEANALALNASGFADAAEKSATAANNSATAASQSAQNAANSATQAGNAATNAETSSRAAETAKNAAEKAKTDAETALQSVRQEAEAVEAAGAQAVENIGEAKNDALGAIDKARDNVYTKSEIDGVATGAEVTLKMNEIIGYLKDYEAVTGEKLPFDFWEAVMAEFQRWQENPNEVKEWVTTSATESTSPYFSTPPTRPVVDFNVKTAKGLSVDMPCFSRETNTIIFLPSVTNAAYFLERGNRFDSLLILPNAVDCRNAIYESESMKHDVFLPSATICSAMMVRATTFNGRVIVPNAKECNYMLYGASKFDRTVELTACRSAQHAFYSTAMSAENISATLDSLPTWTGGASHIITFTGSPGAAHVSTTETITIEIDGQTYTFENFPRFTMDDENETLRYSVARATAKGWEVQMGDPQ